MPGDTSISPRELVIWIVRGLVLIAAVFVAAQLVLDQFPGWFNIEISGIPRWIVLFVAVWAAMAIATRPMRNRLAGGKQKAGKNDGI